MKNIFAKFLALIAFSSLSLQAQLRITEAMSSGTTWDWFEVTNYGGSAANITGYKVDDSSNSFAVSLALNGVTSIAAGESVIFMETAAPGTDIPAFRTLWGGINTIQIGSYSGSGIGLSATGDGVNLFDSGGNFITGVSFGAATTNTSFVFDFSGTPSLSVSGANGAFTSANSANIGSPGFASAIPEPSSYATIFGALALTGALVRRRGRQVR